MDYPVNNIMAGIFYPRVEMGNAAVFAGDFIKRTGDLLDGEPVVVPVNQPAPPEAPRVVLRGKTGGFVCEFARNRVNFHYHCRGQSPSTYEGLFPNYRKGLYSVITALAETLPDKPVRLGFVVKFVKRTSVDGSQALRQAFVDDERFDDAIESHLHFLHELELANMPCNRWSRLTTARPPGAPKAANAVILEVDINTRADYQRIFEPHDVISFYLEAYEAVRSNAQQLLDFDDDGDE